MSTNESDDALRVEIPTRQRRIKEEMSSRAVDVLVLTGQASFEYFTGYHSEFWVSTTRPFYGIIVPDRAESTVVIHRSEQRSTAFDIANNKVVFYELFLDDGLKTLRHTVAALAPSARKIAIDYGNDLVGRGSLLLESMLRDLPSHPAVVEGDEMIWSVRAIKSEYEIEMKRRACHIAPQSFFSALATLELGQSENDFARTIKATMFQKGAHGVDFLPVRFGKSEFAYLRPPSDKPLEKDDYIWVDMGCIVNGYHSDLNRIAKAGIVTDAS
jgi:Xaa-Pro dipeptidase